MVQKDGQILEWAKNNKNNEVTAIAAAKEMRSRVEDRRNRDEGKEISTGKAVQHLVGYFCEDRLQVWTDGSRLDPRWEAIARAGAGVFFSEDSELIAHFSIKAKTGQTSVRGELEAAACIILALDVPMRIRDRARPGSRHGGDGE